METLFSLGKLLLALLAGEAARHLTLRLMFLSMRQNSRRVKYSFKKHFLRKKPLLGLFWSLSLVVGLPLAEFQEPYASYLHRFISIAVILSTGWFFICLTYVLEDYLLDRYKLDVRENLRNRRLRTQVEILKRLGIFSISVLAIGFAFLSIEKGREFGASLLASAGVVGLIFGFAAQKTITNVLAGLQIAFTQPVKMNDIVIVEGDWGKVEEITLTYVVVKAWDLRRVVLPITYFLDNPFQNLSRVSTDIYGAVFLYLDYSLPVQKLREELRRILYSTRLWDRKSWFLQVTDAKERTMEVRALMSARDSATAFDLKCYVRERLIEYIQKNFPECLPKDRQNQIIEGYYPGYHRDQQST